MADRPSLSPAGRGLTVDDILMTGGTHFYRKFVALSFGSDVYLVEAKWQTKLTSQDDLLIFREKVESKSAWTRGLFVSYSGFSEDGITAFARGRATNIIGMTGQDLHFILSGDISLPDSIARKTRCAAETGEFFKSVFDLLRT
jgi:hypothetical protein